jgi:hypothetical protein
MYNIDISLVGMPPCDGYFGKIRELVISAVRVSARNEGKGGVGETDAQTQARAEDGRKEKRGVRMDVERVGEIGTDGSA